MKREVEVRQTVVVGIDESKFDEAFMEEFRSTMYPFKTLDDHLKHLAQLHVRGLADNKSFIEGYGEAAEMGISFEVIDQAEELV